MQQEQAKQESQWWKLAYAAVLIFTMVVGAVFQFGNIGWFLVIFGLLYLIGFGLELLFWGGVILLRKRPAWWLHLLFGVNSLAFLVANVLNLDFGDINSYMFFMQWEDPPEYFMMVSMIGWVIWLLTLAATGGILGVAWLRAYLERRSEASDNPPAQPRPASTA